MDGEAENPVYKSKAIINHPLGLLLRMAPATDIRSQAHCMPLSSGDCTLFTIFQSHSSSFRQWGTMNMASLVPGQLARWKWLSRASRLRTIFGIHVSILAGAAWYAYKEKARRQSWPSHSPCTDCTQSNRV